MKPKMPGGRSKFWCEECDHVAKALAYSSPRCPRCGLPMRDMGTKWRVGPKGHRADWRRAYRPSAGERLLDRLLNPRRKPRSWRDEP